MRAAILFLVLATALAVAVIEGAAYVALHRQDFPWTRLDLDDPVGLATGRKLAALANDPGLCRALLADIGDSDRPVPPKRASADCGYDDGMRLVPEDVRSIGLRPAGPVTSCPVAAALALWERDVVQPAALRRFGLRLATVDHAGSYSCRRLYGRSEGGFSEHASANAFDVLGFRLADGRTISVLRDWPGNDPGPRSSGTFGTAAAGYSRPSCRPIITPLTPIICTSTRRAAAQAAGACAGNGRDSRCARGQVGASFTIGKGPRSPASPFACTPFGVAYFRWFERCLFISNIVQRSLPKTLRSLSSARISRLFCGFCRLFLRM